MELRHQQKHERDLAGSERDRREDELPPQLWPGKRMRTNAQSEVDSRMPDLRRIRGALGALRTGGKPLPGALSAEYSKLLGLDLSDVRVHHGGVAGAAARSLGATAFTHGTDIALAEQLDLESAFGRHVLAHELVHVAQHKRSGGDASMLAARMEIGPSGSVIEAEAERGAKALAAGREFAVGSHGRLPGISLYGEGEQEPNACTPPVQVPGTSPAPNQSTPPPASTPETPPANQTPAPAPAPAPAPTQTPGAQPGGAQPGGVQTGPQPAPSGSTAPARTPQPGAPAPAGTARPGGYSAPPSSTPAPAAPRGDLDARVQEELEKRADPTLKANYSKGVAGVDALRIQALQFSFQPNGIWNTLVETFTAKNAFQDHFGQIYSANAYRGGRSWADTAQAWIEGLRGVIHIIGDIASVVAAWAGMAALVTGALALILSETVIGGIALGAIAAIAAEVAMVAGAIKLLTDIIDFILGILQMIILIVRARSSKDPGERARFAALLRKEANDFGANVISIGVQVAVMAATAGVGAALSKGTSTFTQELAKAFKPVVMPRAAIRNIAALTRSVAPGAGVAARGTNIFGNSAPRQVLAIEVRDGLVNISRLQRNALGQVTRNRQIIPFTTANQMRGARLVAARTAIRTAVRVNTAGFVIGTGGAQLQSQIKQPRTGTSPSAQSNRDLGQGARAGSDLSTLQMWPSQLEMFESSKGPIGGAVDRTQRQYELAESAAGPALSAQVRTAFQSANNQAGQARFGAMAVQSDAAEGQANTQRGLQQTAQGRDGQNRMGQQQSAAGQSVDRINSEGGKLQSPPPKEGVLGYLYNQTIGRIGGWIASAQSWVTNLVGKWAMSLAGFSKEEMDIAGIENDMREDDKQDATSSQEAQDAALKADEVQQTVFRLQENKTRDEQAAIQGMADAQRFIMALEDAERRLAESIASGQNYIQQVTPIIRHELETEDAGAAIDAAYVAPVAAYAAAFSASIDSSNLGNRARSDGNGQLSAIKGAFPDIDIAPGQAAVGQAVARYETAFGQLAGQARGQAEAMQTAIQAFIGTTDYDGVNENARSLDRLAADFDRAAQQLADQLYAAINGVITQYNNHIQAALDAANSVPDDPDAPADEPASTAAPASTPVATPTVPAAAPTGTSAPDAAPNASVQRKSDPNAPKPTTTPAGGTANKTASSATPAAVDASKAPASASPAGPTAPTAPTGGAIEGKSPDGAPTAKQDAPDAAPAGDAKDAKQQASPATDGSEAQPAGGDSTSPGGGDAASSSSSPSASDGGAASSASPAGESSPASDAASTPAPAPQTPAPVPPAASAAPVRKQAAQQAQAPEATGPASAGGEPVSESAPVPALSGGERVEEDEDEDDDQARKRGEPSTADESDDDSEEEQATAGPDDGATSGGEPSFEASDELESESEESPSPVPAAGHAVQRRADGRASAANPVEVATRATAGSGGSLPFFQQIQASFGRHEVAGIRAHDSSAAQEGATQLGATAFAVGDAVAFKSSPDLHTAAHEAAHVVQQRAGLRPSGGIDTGAGDSLEQQADAVADAVVSGRSAQPLLDAMVRGGGASSVGVQRKGEVPTIKSQTAADAKENPNKERFVVGVGEEISFTGSEAGTWTASGGTPDSGSSSDTFAWTAPGKAGQFTIKLKVGDKEARKDIAVVEPSSIRFKAEQRTMPSRGIGFTLGVRMTVLPLNVSFEAATIQEIGGGASNVTGYFKTAQQKGLNLTHTPRQKRDGSGAAVTTIDPGNDAGIDDATMGDSDSEGELPRPISVGSMTWQIPYAYNCGDTSKKNFTIVTQTMSIIDPSGSVTITKGLASDTRAGKAEKTAGQFKEEKEAAAKRKAEEAKEKAAAAKGSTGFAAGYAVGHADDGYSVGRGGRQTRGSRTPPPAPTGPAAVTVTPESFSMEGEHVGRTNVGVGEKVKLETDRRGDWTATQVGPRGRTTRRNNKKYTWTAPATPASVTITFTPRDGTAAVTTAMTVIKPSSVDFIIPSPARLPRGMGAGMVTNVRFLPFTVSFARTSWKELPGPATGKTGYFRTHTPPDHDGRGGRGPNRRWLGISEGNGGPTDTAAFGGFPAPWTAGSFNWVIPNRYRVDGESGDGHEIGDVVQTCVLQGPPAAGTVTVTKGSSSDTRPAPAARAARPRRGRGHGFGAGSAAAAAGPASSPVDTATKATQGSAGKLPHLDRIQASFGKHDVSQVRSHEDGQAKDGAAKLGAQAFAVGEDVAFGADPDLHTAAHEAAHVVQQRGGSAPDGGMDTPGDSLEQQADAVADAVVAGESAEPLLDEHGGDGEGTGRATVAVQRVPDPFVVALEAKLDAKDLPGFYGDLAGLNGSRAMDAALHLAMVPFVPAKLTYKQLWRAFAFKAFGPLTSWPLQVKNYADGIDKGSLKLEWPTTMGPDALRELCVLKAGEQADGKGTVLVDYRVGFNARFDSARFSALSDEFDPALDSKGPRSQRARAIFLELYAEARFKTAYDTNAPAGFRDLCDTLVGPDGTNLTASPRLHELRATLTGATVTAANTAAPAYTALVAVVTPKAEALDARDRQELDQNHTWKLAVDAKVAGPTPADTAVLRDDLWTIVSTSRSAAAPVVAPAAAPAVAGPAAPTPSAKQKKFLSSIKLSAPKSPVNASGAEEWLEFKVRGKANPGLAGVKRRIVIEPSAQVLSGQEDETEWPNKAKDMDHYASVDPAGGPTVFTAKLTMPPLPTSDFPEQTATITVNDKRLDWIKKNLDAGLTYVDDTDSTAVTKGGKAHYTGKQCPIEVTPSLPGSNPGVDIELEGELKKGGVIMHPIARQSFGTTAPSLAMFATILQEPTPAPSKPEKWELVLRVFQSSGAVAIHTIKHPFTIAKSKKGSIAKDKAQMAKDNKWLNRKITKKGSLLHYMNKKGGAFRAVARGVASGALKVKATFVRSDSADQVIALKGAVAAEVAYAMGVVDPIGTATHTLVGQPGASAWAWGSFPDTVFLNVTPHPGGGRRSIDELAGTLAHEGIHAADRDAGAPGEWDRYTTEFRAYWIDGLGDGESTAFDPTMTGLGPKSPRARAIFEHLYGSATYDFVKPAYDENEHGFRERADNYLFPDGINLVLSGKLTDLRSEIEKFVPGPGAYAAAKPAILAKFGACTPGDKKEITTNREWRDLVEQTFTGMLPPPAVKSEKDDMKDELGIPR